MKLSSSSDIAGCYELGGCTVTVLRGGALRLDGGAMFGIIPKVVWSRRVPADEDNRIQLACNSLLVEWEGSGRRLIIEVGHGPKYSEKEQRIFAIDPRRWLAPVLDRLGVERESITDVVLTHLHFDHAGGLTHEQGGRLVATFPRARVHVQRREFDDARAGFGIMTATYREENFRPIDEIDGWNLLDGAVELAPGVRTLPTPGHTRGHQSIVIEGRERTLVYTGDVMPTRAHLGGAYNMAYDLFPLDNRQSKYALLEQAARGRWIIVFTHEPGEPAAEVRRCGKDYELQAVSGQ